MRMAHGFEENGAVRKACKLKKSLYGSKQLPSTSFIRFGTMLGQIGYRQSKVDHTLFIKNTSSGKKAVLIV